MLIVVEVVVVVVVAVAAAVLLVGNLQLNICGSWRALYEPG
jgi:hypothetical protein